MTSSKLYCCDFKTPCCSSCHEDIDYGIDLCVVEGHNKIAYVCCAIIDEAEERFKNESINDL